MCAPQPILDPIFAPSPWFVLPTVDIHLTPLQPPCEIDTLNPHPSLYEQLTDHISTPLCLRVSRLSAVIERSVGRFIELVVDIMYVIMKLDQRKRSLQATGQWKSLGYLKEWKKPWELLNIKLCGIQSSKLLIKPRIHLYEILRLNIPIVIVFNL